MKKMMFLAGLATGYVLGTRAGREKYDQLSAAVKDVTQKPAVQDAINTVQTQASKLYGDSKAVIAEKLDRTSTPVAPRVADPDLIDDVHSAPVG
jgi:tripartite-type tricarboxylate transporter receptor subunit TctC